MKLVLPYCIKEYSDELIGLQAQHLKLIIKEMKN